MGRRMQETGVKALRYVVVAHMPHARNMGVFDALGEASAWAEHCLANPAATHVEVVEWERGMRWRDWEATGNAREPMWHDQYGDECNRRPE